MPLQLYSGSATIFQYQEYNDQPENELASVVGRKIGIADA
jgi:hypothetical protein